MTAALLQVHDVSKRFEQRADLAQRLARLAGAAEPPRVVRALDRVNIELAEGEVLGLVGESGCGKSTLGRIVAGLMSPSEGSVRFRGADGLGKDRLAVQMIFQDPMSSLNPRMRIVDTLSEAAIVHGLARGAGKRDFVAGLMGDVGLDPATMDRYPHQFSGGQRQRICIARALSVEPSLIVCDEAVAALDVSIQAQVLNLFMELRRKRRLTYLFISHDLGVVEHISDRVAIMYLGRIVEMAPTPVLFSSPQHPYTRALIAQKPRLGQGKHAFEPIKGEIPSPLAPPPGCHFHPRCPHAFERCRTEPPALRPSGPGRIAACHLVEPPP